MSGDLALAIARLGLDRPVVVGQSWGGNVVLELAARRPELVAGIACVDGGTIELSEAFPSWEACAAQLAPPRLAGLPLAELEGHLRAAHRDWDDVAIAGTLASFEVRPDGTIAPRLTFDRHMTILHELWRHRPSERYWSLPVPVLLVPADTGEADWTDRKRAQVELAEERLPQARVRWFSPADHDIQSQRPGELADVLIDAMRDGFFG